MASNGNPARISATLIRDDLANIVNRVAFGGERIILERRGSDVAAIVSMEDLRRLEEAESTYWARQADEALSAARPRGQPPIPFYKLERRIERPKKVRAGR